jgi:hypothetical protein
MNSTPSENGANKARLIDIYSDLNEFLEAKRSVNELIQFKNQLDQLENSEKVNALRVKAMDALNNLFEEENTEGN